MEVSSVCCLDTCSDEAEMVLLAPPGKSKLQRYVPLCQPHQEPAKITWLKSGGGLVGQVTIAELRERVADGKLYALVTSLGYFEELNCPICKTSWRERNRVHGEWQLIPTPCPMCGANGTIGK